MIQEWWGLTQHIRDVTERFAREGFVALAPDLYGGETTHDADEANRMSKALPIDKAVRDLSGAVDILQSYQSVTSDRVGVVGFCMGGRFVLVLASHAGDQVGGAVSFYPDVSEQIPNIEGISAPVLIHVGDRDHLVPSSRVDELETLLRQAGAPHVSIHRYEEARHAFFNDGNQSAYHVGHAKLAWDRTLAFLRANL